MISIRGQNINHTTRSFRILSHTQNVTTDLVPLLYLAWHSIFLINTLKQRQNGRHFPYDIFKWIFLNENVWLSINISLKFVPMSPINNISTLVQVMAWRRPGDKPLYEPMMDRLPTHICVTQSQWVIIINYLRDFQQAMLFANHLVMRSIQMWSSLTEFQAASCARGFL